MKSDFEKWYRDKYQVTKQLYFFEDTQRYEDGFAQDAWEVWQHRQTEVDEMQKRVDAAFRVLSQLNALDDEAHKRWKREACMFSQGESNAYEHAVRLLEQALKGGLDE